MILHFGFTQAGKRGRLGNHFVVICENLVYENGIKVKLKQRRAPVTFFYNLMVPHSTPCLNCVACSFVSVNLKVCKKKIIKFFFSHEEIF
jgi:hypothetical protein